MEEKNKNTHLDDFISESVDILVDLLKGKEESNKGKKLSKIPYLICMGNFFRVL